MRKNILIFIGIVISLIGIFYIVAPLVLLAFVGPLPTLFSLNSTKSVTGVIVDCESSKPIGEASVTLYGNGWGWGENGGLLWDKTYSSATISNSTGAFTIQYKLGTSLVTQKDGYHTAQNFVKNGEQVDVRLRKITDPQLSNQRTYNCMLESECYKTRIENDVEISWNNCLNPR